MSTRLLLPLLFLLACFSLTSGLQAAIPAISAGDSHSLFLKSNGTAWACGKNSDGQVGNGSFGNVTTPVQVMTDVQAISAGSTHSLFLKSNGTVWACGANNHGQLGDGSSIERDTPVQITSLSGVKAIAAGYQFSLFLKTDGSVWACGNNNSGQFGTGGSSSNTPVQVNTDVQAIAAGGGESGRFVLVLKTNGSVWGSGSNGSGQLGDGSSGTRYFPVQATGLSSGVTAISAGESHSLFLKSDGSVWACGSNSQGPFGNGSPPTSSIVPVQVQTGIQAIEAGYLHSLFVRSDGSAIACGYNQSSQLGDGSNMTRHTPVQPTGMSSGMQAVSGAGGIQGSHSLFMKIDGSVWASGENSNGQLGDGSLDDRSFPVQVLQLIDTPVVLAPSATAITSTSATLGGNVFSAGVSAVTTRGVVLAPTATNANPALGGSGVTNLSTTGSTGIFTVNATSLVPGTAYSFRAYATNSQGTGYTSTGSFTAPSNVATLSMLYLSDGTLFPGFASGTFSYTATAHFLSSNVTVYPSLTQANATITVNGAAATSGSGSIVPLSLGSNTITIVVTAQDGTTTRTYTIAVTKPGFPPTITTHPLSQRANPGAPVTFTVAATAAVGQGPLTYQWRKNHVIIPGATGPTYSISSTVSGDTGLYYCTVTNWGSYVHSQGANFVVCPYNPVLETAAISAGFSEGEFGHVHSLFLKTDGSAWASGGNTSGQLGDGTTSNRYSPVQALTGVKAITAGHGRSFFLKPDGSVWACGSNSNGLLGDGTTTSRNPPVQVMTGVKAISTSDAHSLFLKTDGSVWACGNNTHGQLGDGTTTSRGAPVQVMTGVKAIATSNVHSLFLKIDGSVWACGNNQRGQLGYPTYINVGTPTPVQVMVDIQAIDASGEAYDNSHSLFLKHDGSVWVCGSNGNGQLADPPSYLFRRETPVQVMTGVQAIAAGHRFSLFLKIDGSVWGCGTSEVGQLGDPALSAGNPTPVQVPGMTNVQAISAGRAGSLFLKTDGYVWACGLNSSGEHGTGWNDVHWSPVQSLLLIAYQPDPWQQANFGANATNEQISGWDADPDRDGLVNLLERAFNLPPLTPGVPIVTPTGTAGLPRIWVSQGPGGPVLNVQYLRLKASTNPGLTYTPQFSSGLTGASWSAASGTESVVSIDTNWERVTITDTVTNTTRFARVKVLKLP